MPRSNSCRSVIVVTLELMNEQRGRSPVMKYQTNNKPSVRRHEHEAMRGIAAAANYIHSALSARPRVYVSTHLDAPRTASSQCLLDDADIAATVRDAISCITTVPDRALQVSA